MYSTKIMQFRDQTRPFCKDPVYSRFLLRGLILLFKNGVSTVAKMVFLFHIQTI